ncbi:DUF4191 domain-containing protein [Brachybacterium sp. EF45031]|nr:DUF4191 domain-containing protein [Brachybacterium sillae]
MIEVYKFTQATEPSTLPWMVGAFLIPVIVLTLLTLLIFDSLWYGLLVGIMIGLLAALTALARRAERAAYSRIAGQKGAALAAMQSIRRGWNVEQEPAQIDPRSQDMIFRASGRAGVALVGEGSSARTLKLLDKERSRVARLLPNVPIHQILVGDGPDEIPVHKLAGYMTRMKPTLTKHEAGEVARRLQAMPNPIRQAIPKGIDPQRARPSRRALRGR